MYVLENGLRKVVPYYFEYRTTFKQRWLGRTAPHVLCSELGQRPDAVSRGVQNGTIYVTTNNGRAVASETIAGERVHAHGLQPHDVVHNRQHVHEPPVVGDAIEVVHENTSVLVVNKPGGVATHPGGTYRYNTLSEIVRHDRGTEVWPVHRLDKATLGIVVLAKTKPACRQYMELFLQKNVLEKWYVARVAGDFPYAECSYTCPVFSVNSSGGYVNCKSAGPATTVFRKARYLPDLDHSVVWCRPISGRMHQIRIHLRNLGHPIANDPYYGGGSAVEQLKEQIELELYVQVFAMHPEYGRAIETGPDSQADTDTQTDTETLKDTETRSVTRSVTQCASEQVGPGGPTVPAPPTVHLPSLILPEIASQLAHLASLRATETTLNPNRCTECGQPEYATTLDHGIWLHAYSLRHTGHFAYETPLPLWAR